MVVCRPQRRSLIPFACFVIANVSYSAKAEQCCTTQVPRRILPALSNVYHTHRHPTTKAVLTARQILRPPHAWHIRPQHPHHSSHPKAPTLHHHRQPCFSFTSSSKEQWKLCRQPGAASSSAPQQSQKRSSPVRPITTPSWCSGASLWRTKPVACGGGGRSASDSGTHGGRRR